MPTLSDARFEALRSQGFTGSTSDMVLQWLHANGASSPSVPDAWREMLEAQGADPLTYHHNDAWFTLLGIQGYSGALPDRELEFWIAGGTLTQYTFNGIDMYATHSSWNTLGDFSVYGSIDFSASGAQDDVVASTPPIVEFGRVGANYHDGPIQNVRYTDNSPIQNTNVKASSVGDFSGASGVPSMRDTDVEFDFIYAGTETIITGFLSADGSNVLQLTADATGLEVDGTPYAGAALTVGQHYRVKFSCTGGVLTTVNSTLGLQNLKLTGTA